MPGLTVLLLDTEPRTNNAYITLAIADALRRHPGVERVTLVTHGDALHRAQAERPDVFLAFGGAARHHALLDRLCALAGTSVLWTTEDPYESRSNAALAGCFDLVFTNDRSSVARYEGRAEHLALAASPLFQDFEVRGADRDYRYDLLFVGTAWPNRVETINGILEAFPRDLRVKIALPWNEYLKKPALVREDVVFDWRCGNEDFSRLANASRVVLTLPRAFSASAAEHAAGTTPPPRLFEVGLAGGCQLVVGADPEILDYYEAGDEIRVCTEEADVVGEMRDLLGDPARRIAIARRARERTRAEHLYDHRIDVILRRVGERPAAARRRSPAPPERPRVLSIAHNRLGRRPAGGVELYQERLAAALDGFEVLLLYPSHEEGSWMLRLDRKDSSEAVTMPSAGRLLTSAEIEGRFARILVEERIDLVHVHHLLELPLSLPLIARAYGVPVVFHIHDFYAICSRFNLVNQRGVFCDVVHRGGDQCDSCLLTADGFTAGSKARRDGFVARMLRAVDAFVASTPYSADYLRAFYPEVARTRLAMIEMVDAGPQSEAAPALLDHHSPEDGLRIAVLGNVNDHKGAQTLVELVELARGQGYVFEILGYVETHLVAHFRTLAGPEVRLHGGYTQDEVPDLLAGCDVSLHLSLWPETYMIALSEAWRAGLVPIVTDLGAPGERVTDGVDGLKVPPDQAGAVLRALRRLRHDPPLMRRMREAIARKRLSEMRTHADEVARLYADLIAAHPVVHATRSERPAAYGLTAFDVGIRVNSPDWTSPRHVWDGEMSVRHASVVTESLPIEFAGLPETLVRPDDPAISDEISDVSVDEQHLGGRIVTCAMADTLTLRGWVWDARDDAGRPTYLRIRQGAGVRFATVHPERRPDLAARLGRSAEHAGFSATIEAATLSPGDHAIDVIRILPDAAAVIPGVMRVHCAGVPALGPAAPWQTGAPLSGALSGQAFSAQAISGGRVEAHSLQMLAGMPVARRGSVFRLVVRLPEDARRPDQVAVVLRGDDGRTHWCEAGWDDGDGSGRVLAESRVHGLAPGSYRALVAGRGEAGDVLYDPAFALFVTGGSQACLHTRAPPRPYLSRWVRRARGRPNLDAARVVDDSPLFGEPSVVVSGWVFERGRGRPLACAATWGTGDERRTLIVESLRRQDVAVHLRDGDAVTAGFEIEVPLRAIMRSGLHVVQIYEKGAVAHRDFATRVKSMLTAADVRLIAESGVFSPEWYTRQRRPATEPILDYLLHGAALGFDPHPLFATDWYLRRYPDVAASGRNPLVHYLSAGARQGCNPGPLFASRWYTARRADVGRSELTPLAWYAALAQSQRDPTTPLFEAGETGDATRDFAAFLATEPSRRRDPTPFLLSRPVDRDGEGGVAHWLSLDAERRPLPVDAGWYARQYRDVVAHAADATAEYARGGRRAGRVPVDPAPRLAGARIAVVAHVFYEDLWPQMLAALRRIPLAFDLFVTCPEDQARSVRALVDETYPGAHVLGVPNEGRDVGPFFRAFAQLRTVGDYTAICKIHTKKGVTSPEIWRHVLLDSVLGSSTLVCDVVRSFLDRPNLGLVGSRDLYFSGPRFVGPNDEHMRRLADAVHPGRPIPPKWGFVAGTMFWARPAMLAPLADHVGRSVDFERDSVRNDGQVAHALERLFGLAAAMGGYEVGLVDPTYGGPIPHALAIHPSPGLPREERPEVYLGRKAAEFERYGDLLDEATGNPRGKGRRRP